MNNQYTWKVWKTLEEWYDEDCGGNWEVFAKVVRKWKRKYKKFGDKLNITVVDDCGVANLWCGYYVIHYQCDAHVELYRQQKKTEEQERLALINSPQRQAIRRMIEEYKRQRAEGHVEAVLLKQLKEVKNADV